MIKRQLFYLIVTTLVILSLLILITSLFYLRTPPSQKLLSYNDVNGIAIEKNNVFYTLNFQQQNELIGFLNHAAIIDPPLWSEGSGQHVAKPSYTKIAIYRFDNADIEISPLAYIDGQLLFTSPAWFDGKQLIDTSNGALKQLLENTCQ